MVRQLVLRDAAVRTQPGGFCQLSRQHGWSATHRPAIAPPLIGGADGDAVCGVRVGGGDRAIRTHRSRLPQVPLPRLWQAVQRVFGHGAEPGPIPPPTSSPSWCSGGCAASSPYATCPRCSHCAAWCSPHEAVRDWEAKLTPALAEELRRRRRGKVGRSWHVDETHLRVAGRWCYVYRAIDKSGALVDAMFSERRDMAAAKAFFRSARAVTGTTPDRVTTDGHDSYPRAIRTELGKAVRHRTSRHLNNRLEQDHRGIKGRYRPMRGFKCPRSAARFCRGHDELRNFLRLRSRQNQHVSADRRRLLTSAAP